jgi:methionine synthase / methylenetetrahydrofolate reductase(NADPH)
MQPLTRVWNATVLLADGAMGTLLLGRAGRNTTCVELLNVDNPREVERAHAEYVAAGAQLIETNTFAANRLKLAAHEAAPRLMAINAEGVAIARRAAAGRAYVAGSIGPLGALLRPIGVVERAEASDVFAEHVAAVVAGAPDLLLLETFVGLDEALLALRAARNVAASIPVLVSLSVLDDGKTPAGDDLLAAFLRLREAGADACGVNCAVGPQAVFDAIAPIIDRCDFPISLMPNAGYPQSVGDRTVYESAPPYFARFAAAYVELGASIIGGCCGTTPEHVAAMAPEVVGKRVRPRTRGSATALHRRPTTRLTARAESPAAVGPENALRSRAPTAFERKLGLEFVVTAELAAPRGTDAGAMLAAARRLAAAGVDALHISDNPTARVRMAGVAAAHVVMRETGVATVLHLSCRDRNLIGLQSELIGASALGVTAILPLTGDPSNVGDFPKATSVFDVTALGLTQIVRNLNAGMDQAGNDIGGCSRFRIGAAANPMARDLPAEMARLAERIDAGADFVVTQPVFDIAAVSRFLERLRERRVPVLAGLLPLRSFENAEYLHNEVPGMQIPEPIRERMRAARDGQAEGVAIARDLMVEFSRLPGVAGVYVICQEQYELAAEVIAQGLRRRAAAV